VLSSEVVFEGPLFRVLRDRLIEPGGREGVRDIIRHNGSVVILAVDKSKNKRNPWIVMERQYRHAAGRFLWELPAGKLEAGRKCARGRKAGTRRRDRLQGKEVEAAGRVLRQPRLSGRVDEGLPGRRAGGGRGSSRGGRKDRVAPGQALRGRQAD
jgi:hypothetical protein